MNSLRFALVQLTREWRRGDLLLLVAAVTVAVAAATAVSLFTDRVRQAIATGSGEAIAADLRLTLRAPLDPDRRAAMRAADLRTAEVVTFPSVARASDDAGDDNNALVAVKAVDPNYPLRGALQIERADGQTATLAHGPPPGELWVQRRVLAELGLRLGQRLQLGESTFDVGARLIAEPDAGASLPGLAPRVLMHRADLPATRLLGPGSRANYRALLAGKPGAIQAYRAAHEGQLAVGEAMENAAEARPALRRALDRAEVFLDLAALVTAILAGVAIAMAAHQHALRRYDEIALIKTLGAPSGFLGRMLAWQLVILGCAGIAAGLILGAVAQLLLAQLAAQALAINLPAPAVTAFWPGALSGAAILLGFAWPALARARNAPPARVFQRALPLPGTDSVAVYAAALATVAALVVWQAEDWWLSAYVLGGGLLTTAVLWAAAQLLLAALARLTRSPRLPAGGWRQGLQAVLRRPRESSLLIVAFGIGLSVLFVLAIVRADLLAGWRANIAADAPNRFLVNIAPDQVDAVGAYFRDNGLPDTEFYPIVRARLIALNGRELHGDDLAEQAAGELLRRELNLSWHARLKPDNEIVAGRWFRPSDQGKPLVSIDTSVAERLDAGLGDRLGFDMAGQRFTARIASIRTIDWDSLQANFYMLFAPGFLADYPATYITALNVAPNREDALAGLVRVFPNISTLDIGVILAQLRNVIERISLAVEFVFAFSLAAGVLLLLAAVQATRAERRREAAVMRALGAGSRRLQIALLAEFSTIGLLAALLATLCAQLLAVILATQLLDLTYTLRPLIWLTAIATASAAIALTGLLGVRDVLRQPAMASLD